MKRRTVFEAKPVVLARKGNMVLKGSVKIEEVTEGEGDDAGCTCGWTAAYARNYEKTFGRKERLN